jgi:hypothetical protein
MRSKERKDSIMDKFTVTTGNKDTTELNRLTRAIALHDIWNRQYHNTVKYVSKAQEFR